MSQSTLVLVVPAAARRPLRERLARAEFEWRTVPHALFSVKSAEVVATLYKSGKLVIQGRDPELFAERFVEGAAPAKSKGRAPRDEALLAAPLIGSDECGKGDFFGPLVVAAVRADPDQARQLAASGVADSKQIADERALRMGAALRGVVSFAVRRLDPVDYNQRYGREGKLNELLAGLHAEVIRELAQPGDHVLIDQFAKRDLIGPQLTDLELAIEQRPRAESNPVVAAASVIAREAFLVALRELSEEHAIDLHKGAGAPVDKAGVAFVRLHGFERLGEVAKLHFKNTEKVRARLG